MNCITADYIFDGKLMHNNAGVVFDPNGVIQELYKENDFNKSDYKYYPGLITPGFINTHCHLELSHLKNKFRTGTGLLTFLNAVVKNREEDPNKIFEAIHYADREMYLEGIVAVGDISNKTDTIKTKINSEIIYYNFIECFDFLQEDKSTEFLEIYKKVYDEFGSLHKSLVPHAPYSVSQNLFLKINTTNSPGNIISIHNQEVSDEDDLFINKSGGFEQFFSQFGFSLKDFTPIGKTSVHYTMSQLNAVFQTIFVHNTHMQESEIAAVMKWNSNSYFATCPNANLFIENKLPNYNNFIKQNACVCIGTDSLSSNWRLSILEEIKTIQKYQSSIPLEECLLWATFNGAKALKLDKQIGSIEKNKKPGLNWIQEITKINNELKFTSNSSVYKII